MTPDFPEFAKWLMLGWGFLMITALLYWWFGHRTILKLTGATRDTLRSEYTKTLVSIVAGPLPLIVAITTLGTVWVDEKENEREASVNLQESAFTEATRNEQDRKNSEVISGIVDPEDVTPSTRTESRGGVRRSRDPSTQLVVHLAEARQALSSAGLELDKVIRKLDEHKQSKVRSRYPYRDVSAVNIDVGAVRRQQLNVKGALDRLLFTARRVGKGVTAKLNLPVKESIDAVSLIGVDLANGSRASVDANIEVLKKRRQVLTECEDRVIKVAEDL
jgi:hypothetical protein